VEEELRDNGHEIDRVDVADLSIGGCTGCGACMVISDTPGCVIEDDAQRTFERMMAADAILFASPLYTWGFACQMKPLVDRCVCLVKDYGGPSYKSFIGGKRGGLVITCGWGIENNVDLIQVVFERLADYYNLEPAGNLIVPNCTEPDQLPEDVKTQAVVFAQKLTA
jgi:multimeric flavodoxin WrbA